MSNPQQSQLQKMLNALYLELPRDLADQVNTAIAIEFDKQKKEFKEKFLSESFGALDVVLDACDYIETPDSSMFVTQLKRQLRKQAEIAFN